jgi:hypothetical protein
MQNITTAQSNWFNRPADERFSSLTALHAAAQADRYESIERPIPVGDLKVKTDDTGSRILLNGRTHAAAMTHYAFSQLATLAGAPAGYMRRLPAPLAVNCLAHGLQSLADETKRTHHKVYLRAARDASGAFDPTQGMTAKAVTSNDYARIYDADLVERLIRIQENNPQWHLPTDWNNTPSGAFRGDRDLFVLMVDGGSVVEDPTISLSAGTDANARAMFRGMILRNSEVGHCALTLQTFMFRVVCGNLCIWGAENIKTIRRRHVGAAHSLMWKVQDGFNAARLAADRPASRDEQAIARLNTIELGKNADEVTRVGQDAGLSAPLARSAYELATIHEDNPRSVWGYAQGITRASQQTADGHQDDRLAIDRIAGALLTKHTRAVYA